MRYRVCNNKHKYSIQILRCSCTMLFCKGLYFTVSAVLSEGPSNPLWFYYLGPPTHTHTLLLKLNWTSKARNQTRWSSCLHSILTDAHIVLIEEGKKGQLEELISIFLENYLFLWLWHGNLLLCDAPAIL